MKAPELQLPRESSVVDLLEATNGILPELFHLHQVFEICAIPVAKAFDRLFQDCCYWFVDNVEPLIGKLAFYNGDTAGFGFGLTSIHAHLMFPKSLSSKLLVYKFVVVIVIMSSIYICFGGRHAPLFNHKLICESIN